MKMKRTFRIAVCVLLLLLLALEAYRLVVDGAVSRREVKESVVRESAAIQARLDARCDAIERRVERVDSKLDGIESKLDRLIDMATPKLPDGMAPAPAVH